MRFGRYACLYWLRHRLRRYVADAARTRQIQHRSLRSKISRNAQSAFGREYGFNQLRTVAEFRARVPILSFDDHQSYLQRVLEGDSSALFAPGTRVLMFAMTSGTTGEPKRLPITRELFREYCAGWRLWGAGVYGDHIQLMDRKTLQLTSDWQQQLAPCGVPCGQISGLAATTRPRLVQQLFLLPSSTSRIHNDSAKQYTSLRLALAEPNLGMIITANPSTLVEFARRADEDRELLIRDIHDGTLTCVVPDDVRGALRRQIGQPNQPRARELERLISRRGALLPRDVWPNLAMLAVWVGGSVGVFRQQLTELYGDLPVRDHGLSASEGRMSIPLSDNTAAGLLDFYHHYFEFIPIEEYGRPQPTVLEAHELEVGRDYFIIITTSGGLYRYDIHDVVRCVGYRGQAPLIEFLNKGKHFSNITGEKLSEHQTIRAVELAFEELRLPIQSFTLAPVVERQPRYVLLVERSAHRGKALELAACVHANLTRLNEEYAAKVASRRLLPVATWQVPAGSWDILRQQRIRGNAEQYKHPCLVNDLDFARRLGATAVPPASAAPVAASAPPLVWDRSTHHGAMSPTRVS